VRALGVVVEVGGGEDDAAVRRLHHRGWIIATANRDPIARATAGPRLSSSVTAGRTAVG
jgi:hypothetical protein